jgi:hypothetical protein
MTPAQVAAAALGAHPSLVSIKPELRASPFVALGPQGFMGGEGGAAGGGGAQASPYGPPVRAARAMGPPGSAPGAYGLAHDAGVGYGGAPSPHEPQGQAALYAGAPVPVSVAVGAPLEGGWACVSAASLGLQGPGVLQVGRAGVARKGAPASRAGAKPWGAGRGRCGGA